MKKLDFFKGRKNVLILPSSYDVKSRDITQDMRVYFSGLSGVGDAMVIPLSNHDLIREYLKENKIGAIVADSYTADMKDPFDGINALLWDYNPIDSLDDSPRSKYYLNTQRFDQMTDEDIAEVGADIQEKMNIKQRRIISAVK